MVKKLENPIQQVLEAERAAEAQIATARQEAETAVTEARKQAPSILRRNETRTQRAVERYAEQQSHLLETKAQALRQKAEDKLGDEQVLLDEHFDQIVEEIFNDVWPQHDQE